MKNEMIIIALIMTLTALIAALPSHKEQRQQDWYEGLVFQDKSFSFEFARTLGHSYGKGADIGEAIRTARLVKDRDIISWHDEWRRLADRTFELAEKYASEGHGHSAREAYLRAANYYRTAEFYLRAPQLREKAMAAYDLSVGSFIKAIADDPSIERIKIPYEGTFMPGYLWRSTSSTAPLVIAMTGYDGTAEEMMIGICRAAVERGYNCLTFEGPGQGSMIRKQGIPMRADWENVVIPVIDYAMARSDFDKDRIALIGVSFGGYLAPRACAFEKRIKACVANGGFYDLADAIYPALPIQLISSKPDEFNKKILSDESDVQTRWFFENGMMVFNVSSPTDVVWAMNPYTLKGAIKNITSPTLVIESESDQFFKGEGKKIFDRLGSPKEYIMFTKEEAADAHCQMGAISLSNEETFNWIDDVFRVQKENRAR